MAKGNRYDQLIEKVFFDHYSDGDVSVKFVRDEFEPAALELGIKLPKNLGDIMYSVRFRNSLPDRIIDTQPDGLEWVVSLAGRGKYEFCLLYTSPSPRD